MTGYQRVAESVAIYRALRDVAPAAGDGPLAAHLSRVVVDQRDTQEQYGLQLDVSKPFYQSPATSSTAYNSAPSVFPNSYVGMEAGGLSGDYANTTDDVLKSRDRINQAKEDWKAMRFALPPDDDKEFIPLPEVPITVSYP